MKLVTILGLFFNLASFATLVAAVFFPEYPVLIALLFPCYLVGVTLATLTIGKSDYSLPGKIVSLTGPFVAPLLALACIQILKMIGVLGVPEANV